ncbi:MAG: ligase-associated DNA damage response endonuclease PdeM [Pseudomonadota bacterium]
MSIQPLSFAGALLTPLPSGGLWWGAERLLCVSDLHLGKSERIARRGGSLLPPYETRETLHRLAEDVRSLAPRIVVSLGDSFDDLAAQAALDDADRAQLAAMMAGRRWIWIEGNHDPGPLELGGEHLAELRHGGLTFRHIAEAGAAPGEVSGHYHPKASLALRGRNLTSACFFHDATRLILPAYGAYTGGLAVTHPDLRGLMDDNPGVILTRAPGQSIPLARCAG